MSTNLTKGVESDVGGGGREVTSRSQIGDGKNTTAKGEAGK